MEGLCGISIDILARLSATADSGDDDTFMRRDTEFFEGIFNRHDDEEVTTAGTPLDVCKT
jgi:hypothetical protein